jgi:hypothetical protein
MTLALAVVVKNIKIVVAEINKFCIIYKEGFI